MPIQHIACATDFSENANRGVMAAIEMAGKYLAHLSIVHVMPPVVNPILSDIQWTLPDSSKDSLILKLEEKMQRNYSEYIDQDMNYDLIVLDGHVSSELLTFIDDKKVDLMVLGAFGLTGMGLVIFGSVAKRVAHKANCSVMIVRDEI